MSASASSSQSGPSPAASAGAERIRKGWATRRANGWKVSAETRAKHSQTHKGKPKSAQHRARIAEGNRTAWAEDGRRSIRAVDQTCMHCGQTFRFHRSRTNCFDCAPDKRALTILRDYGISDPEYQALLAAQGHVCGVCAGPFGPIAGEVRLRQAVDHDHDTGRVRGIIHVLCNRFVGQIEKGLLTRELFDGAEGYLRRTKGRPDPGIATV